jgi:hypothetical protein
LAEHFCVWVDVRGGVEDQESDIQRAPGSTYLSQIRVPRGLPPFIAAAGKLV